MAGSSSSSFGVAVVTGYIPASSGFVTEMRVYLASAGGTYRLALYDSSGSAPANKLWESALTTAGAPGWNSIPLTGSLNLTAGATYWLGYYSAAGLPVQYGGAVAPAQAASSGGGFPDPWSGGPTGSVLSIFAVYCATQPTYTPTQTPTVTDTATETRTPTPTATFTPTCPGGAEAFDLTWSNPTNASFGSDSGAVELDGSFYLLGGYYRVGFPSYTSYYYNYVASYDPGTDSWTTRKQMNNGRSAMGVAAANGRIYVFGGYNNGTVLGASEYYRPEMGTWYDLTPVPTPVYYPMAASVGTTIYVMGGVTSTVISPKVYAYDTSGGTWTEKAALPVACYAASVGVIDGKVYLAGGNVNSGPVSTLYQYDPTLDSWTPRAAMPSAIGNAASAALDGYLYVIGGQDAVGTRVATVYRYDAALDSWSTLTPLAQGRAFTCGAAVGGTIFRNGGLNPSGTFAMDFQKASRVCQ